MIQFLNWFLVLLSLITVGVALAELLIDEDGVKQTKSRLADWYVSIEEADWHDLIRNGALVTDRALSSWLGVKLFSRQALFRWAAFSFTVTLVSVIPMTLEIKASGQLNGPFVLSIILLTLLFGTPCFLIDILFLALNRVLFRRLSDPGSSAWFMVYSLIASYAAVVALGEALCIMFPTLRKDAVQWLLWPYWMASEPRHVVLAFICVLLPATLSTIMLGLACTASVVLYETRTYSKTLVSRIVEKMAEAPKGSLTAITAICTAATAIATNLEHALTPIK